MLVKFATPKTIWVALLIAAKAVGRLNSSSKHSQAM